MKTMTKKKKLKKSLLTTITIPGENKKVFI